MSQGLEASVLFSVPRRTAARGLWGAWLWLLLGGSAVLSAWGECVPLPSPELHELDVLVMQKPAEALRAAQSRLDAARAPADSLVQAELQAIIAEAQATLDHNAESLAALDQGLKILGSRPATPAVARVRLRLQLLRAERMTVTSDSTAAGAALDRILAALPDESIERACALSERAIAYDFANQSDQAVASALGGYRLARAHGWTDPHIETAYTLAVNFRRAGLYDQARRMLDEVIALERQLGRDGAISQAEYELGKLLLAENQPSAARAALERSKEIAERAGDRLGAATANLPLCEAELDAHDLAAAAATCQAGDADLLAAGRLDLETLLRSYRGRLELERGRPAAALAILNAVLSEPIHRLLPGHEAQIYRDRARASEALHRDRDAVVDLTTAHQLERAANLEQRNRQVAVMSAVIASEKLAAENRGLEERLSRGREDLERQRQVRRLWSMAAVAALLLCGVFAGMFVDVRRRNRRLRRYEAILGRTGGNAPDAIMLLDEKRRVCFANRPLFGVGPMPVAGQPLEAVVPGELLPNLTHALDRAFDTRDSVTLESECIAADGARRQHELCVMPAVDGDEALGATLRSTDITELRAVERALLDRASLERQQLGGTLHEGLGQELAGVLLMLGNLAAVINRGRAGAGALVAEIAEQVAQSIAAARRLAQGLAPVALGRGSLGGALDALVEETASLLQIAVTVDCRLEEPLSEPAADHLFRICQESARIAALHGRAKHLAITVRVVDVNLVLTITDDGTPPVPADPAGAGLDIKMMTYRTRLLGGMLDIGPAAGGGTRIQVVVPMAAIRPSAPAPAGAAAIATRRSA